ncbi:MAG: helix-turn-helix domain-containing protein [Pseudomonadota bacterium]
MPNWTKHPTRPVRIAILLFHRFSNLCLANCIEPLRAANTLGARTVFDWQIVSPDGGQVQSSSGIDILASGPCTEVAAQTGKLDYLFVMASYAHDGHDTPANRRMLRQMAQRCEVMVGLDAGPWLLASAGLLDGRRATVHWDLLDAFTERFLNVEADRAHVMRDGPMMTCAGAMSALGLTLDLIADHLGASARLDVEALFLQGDPPLGPSDQIADPLVRQALALMRDHVERPLPLNALATRLSCQPRTLDRHFRRRLGASPGTVYRHMRLSAARKLIEDTQLSVSEIAVRCGYDSPAALTRAIRRSYGAPPRALRQERVG